VPPAAPAAGPPAGASPLRGAAARTVENMVASLAVPTATSARVVPAKLLEENRRLINRHLQSTSGGKVSFTHIIGFAILRALEAMPVMTSSYLEVDGKPHVLRRDHVNFGLAVDVKKSDGSHSLLVPNVKNAHLLDFRGFWAAYEDLIRKVNQNKLSPDDFAGTTVTLTNPGTIGTIHSVPRLMPGQGVIVGTGAIVYPAEFQDADPRTLAALGVSKVLTVTSTYDHRIIQGAESGEFLKVLHELLLGEDDFYDRVFTSLSIPHTPVRWSRDRNPQAAGAAATTDAIEKQARVIQLINAYRVRGHLLANVNPLGWKPMPTSELDPTSYGLSLWDMDREFVTGGLGGRPVMTLREILDVLRDAYCGSIGVEYMHIQEPDQKRWIQDLVEGNPWEISSERKRRILDRLNAAEAFERFLHTKYVGHKRFSLEGAEALIPMLDTLLGDAAEEGMEEVVIGMSHRGRLNVLANTIGKSYGKIFREFAGDVDPASAHGSGDVKYHLGADGIYPSPFSDAKVQVSVASNPSHLEAVDPVVEGMVAAKQDLARDDERVRYMPVLIHGDAAFAGQGVVAETFNLSALHGYQVGGTIHIVVNNQIGFTTAPEAARSTVYATDIAKIVQAPIVHVNGDDAEACTAAIRAAFAFRQAWKKDVVIDMQCYRRWGHNEGDEPAYTQPRMYAQIEGRPTVRTIYTERLVNRKDLSLDEAEAALNDFRGMLESAFEETRQSEPPSEIPGARERPPYEQIDTAVERPVLERVMDALVSYPEGFEPHPKLARQWPARRQGFDNNQIDWATGEALAFGSLLLEGTGVRLAGQDSRRGTFSQRHSVIIDHRDGAEWVPLRHLADDQAWFRIYDSLLSEYAVMGFEYGYSLGDPESLVLWEAQFGDFVNGAQIIVDQFLVAAEDKWGQNSGLGLLLPHGFEGQGPEHSSARIERFLILSAEDNMLVAQPSTAAQYFHLLRWQAYRRPRTPLICFTPKRLLRLGAAKSAVSEFTSRSWQPVLADPDQPDPAAVRRVLLCSGKVAYELIDERNARSAPAAVVRVEQLYPFPGDVIEAALAGYPDAGEVYWVQDEPENMGAWSFMHGRLHRLLRDGRQLRHVSRLESASPAAGSQKVHELEQRRLLDEAFANL
jgi:2-oxoglutarate dehydrogenase E1 component